MAASKVLYVYLVRLDTDLGPIRLCTTGQGLYPTTSKWGAYRPCGAHLTIGKPKDMAHTNGEYFVIRLNLSSEALLQAMLTHNLKNKPVLIYRAGVTIDGGDIIPDEPQLIQRARVSHPEVTLDYAQITCFTPGIDLDVITNARRNWSDQQTRDFVDPHDYAFRFAATPVAKRGLVTHLRKG